MKSSKKVIFDDSSFKKSRFWLLKWTKDKFKYQLIYGQKIDFEDSVSALAEK